MGVHTWKWYDLQSFDCLFFFSDIYVFLIFQTSEFFLCLSFRVKNFKPNIYNFSTTPTDIKLKVTSSIQLTFCLFYYAEKWRIENDPILR